MHAHREHPSALVSSHCLVNGIYEFDHNLIVGLRKISQTTAGVAFEHNRTDAGQGRFDGGNLMDDFPAVALFFNHALDPAYLPFDTAKPQQDILAHCR